MTASTASEDPNIQFVVSELRKFADLTEEQIAACDVGTVKRYLAARGGDARKAARLLHGTILWLKEFNVGTLSISEFSGRDLASGRMYIAGNDPSGKSVLVTRKRSEAFQAGEYTAYLRYMVFTLETAGRAMRGGQDKWVWLMDMRGYSRQNSPPIGVSMATLRILTDHYPERLHRCFFIDAPGIFSFLFNALWPFVDPVTRAKVVFINTKDHAQQIQAVAAAAPGEEREAPDAFCNYLRWYCEPYSEAAYRQLLGSVGWP